VPYSLIHLPAPEVLAELERVVLDLMLDRPGEPYAAVRQPAIELNESPNFLHVSHFTFQSS
jgi:hypothetical protein